MKWKNPLKYLNNNKTPESPKDPKIKNSPKNPGNRLPIFAAT